MKKNVLMLFLSLVCIESISAQVKNSKKKSKEVIEENTLNGKIDTASYAFGQSMARDLKKRGLQGLNADAVAQAIKDHFEGKPSLVTDEQGYQIISEVLEEAAEAQKKEQTAVGDAFLVENKEKPNITTTESGLQYEIIRDADGSKPEATDEVTVHYKGSLLDGKIFDSSYERGEPISFQLNRVIQGWQEGLLLMPVGAHYRFYIPYELGYGERGAGNDIPPYSVLIFDVELIKIGE